MTMCVLTMKQPPAIFQKAKRRKRAITFDKLEIIGFRAVIGDNACSEGAPLGFGAHPEYQVILSVDEYEKQRPRRRSGNQLRLSSSQREDCLLAAGYTTDAVADATRRNAQVRRNRWESYHAQQWENSTILIERVRLAIESSASFLGRDMVLNICSILLLLLLLCYFGSEGIF